jgi:acetoin utilization deacetylase AcuC-like enzyme
MKGRYFRADNCIAQFETELNRLPFSPDMIYIFDGHDSHAQDCGKGITDFTWDDYSRMLKMVLDLSQSNHCPVLTMLGGGYVKDVTVEMAKQIINIMESYRL